jgi:hypothetical protein
MAKSRNMRQIIPIETNVLKKEISTKCEDCIYAFNIFEIGGNGNLFMANCPFTRYKVMLRHHTCDKIKTHAMKAHEENNALPELKRKKLPSVFEKSEYSIGQWTGKGFVESKKLNEDNKWEYEFKQK